MIAGPLARSTRISLARYLLIQVAGISMLFVAAALILRDSGWDLRIEDLFYDPLKHGFWLRHSAWLELLGHQLLLVVPIGIGLLAGIGVLAAPHLKALRPWRPVLWALLASISIGPLLIGILKQFTAAHCPWDVVRYGGYADYVTHWFASSRAEAGRCLPNSHAGAGFSLVALYFAGWAAGRPGWRWSGLAIGLAAGLLFGFVRTAQGAHFASHSLWSAAIDWLIASLVFVPLICVLTRKQSPTAAVTGSS